MRHGVFVKTPMTTTTEKLNAIAAKCRANLALAEKRTPGEWKRAGELATHIISDYSRNNGGMICDLPDTSPDCDQYAPNAAYIAACAGAAEAGWRSTIAAIEGLQQLCCSTCDGSGAINHGGSGEGEEDLEYCHENCQGRNHAASVAIAAIISAWEGLL